MQWKLSDKLVITEVPDAAADSAVLLHLGTRHYFTLNGTGLFIVKQIQQGKSKDQIASALIGRYAVDADQAAASITRLAEDLLRDKLIEPA